MDPVQIEDKSTFILLKQNHGYPGDARVNEFIDIV